MDPIMVLGPMLRLCFVKKAKEQAGEVVKGLFANAIMSVLRAVCVILFGAHIMMMNPAAMMNGEDDDKRSTKSYGKEMLNMAIAVSLSEQLFRLSTDLLHRLFHKLRGTPLESDEEEEETAGKDEDAAGKDEDGPKSDTESVKVVDAEDRTHKNGAKLDVDLEDPKSADTDNKSKKTGRYTSK